MLGNSKYLRKHRNTIFSRNTMLFMGVDKNNIFASTLPFLLLYFFFFLFVTHLLDIFVATPTYQPAPWEVGLEPFPGSYTLPFVFFIMSFFFAVSVYFPFLSFFAGVLILCIVGIISLIFIPRAVFWYGGMEDTSWEVIVFLLAMGVLALTLSYYRLKCYRTDDFE